MLTKRQQKKAKRRETEDQECKKMVAYLENKWKHTVKYNCVHCLKEAYLSELHQVNGYVTDDDLIESSSNKLRHK